jgi:hypothetical protein
MQFVGFRDAIMVGILPQAQVGENGILLVYFSIIITTSRRSIIYS